MISLPQKGCHAGSQKCRLYKPSTLPATPEKNISNPKRHNFRFLSDKKKKVSFLFMHVMSEYDVLWVWVWGAEKST